MFARLIGIVFVLGSTTAFNLIEHPIACSKRSLSTSACFGNSNRSHDATPNTNLHTRSDILSFFASTAPWLMIPFTPAAHAFEGGVGGLGKTKPSTGVVLWDDRSPPTQSSKGLVTAELAVNKQPVLVSFEAPWPILSTTAGLEARDLLQPESAFLQVVTTEEVEAVKQSLPWSKSQMKQILLESVLSQQGKFGAYAAPTDVKVKAVADADDNNHLYLVNFTTFTPGLRESERQLYVKVEKIANGALIFLAGTTRQRFKSQEAVLRRIVDGFEAVPAPTTVQRS